MMFYWFIMFVVSPVSGLLFFEDSFRVLFEGLKIKIVVHGISLFYGLIILVLKSYIGSWFYDLNFVPFSYMKFVNTLDVIEHTIMLWLQICSKGFRSKRDQISTKFLGFCNRVELSVPMRRERKMKAVSIQNSSSPACSEKLQLFLLSSSKIKENSVEKQECIRLSQPYHHWQVNLSNRVLLTMPAMIW